jgi:hypothetical protein
MQFIGLGLGFGRALEGIQGKQGERGRTEDVVHRRLEVATVVTAYTQQGKCAHTTGEVSTHSRGSEHTQQGK